jgi:hypothetical protein
MLAGRKTRDSLHKELKANRGRRGLRKVPPELIAKAQD